MWLRRKINGGETKVGKVVEVQKNVYIAKREEEVLSLEDVFFCFFVCLF